MQCNKLKSFQSPSCNWRVMHCQAARLPYVPSLEELEKFCSTREHDQCHIYHGFLHEEDTLGGDGGENTAHHLDNAEKTIPIQSSAGSFIKN